MDVVPGPLKATCSSGSQMVDLGFHLSHAIFPSPGELLLASQRLQCLFALTLVWMPDGFHHKRFIMSPWKGL